jgi:hypothetical protein
MLPWSKDVKMVVSLPVHLLPLSTELIGVVVVVAGLAS